MIELLKKLLQISSGYDTYHKVKPNNFLPNATILSKLSININT
jgi:hypothetical protein